MFDKLKQLKELRDHAQEMKKILAEESVQGDAGHGKISIVMDGNQEVLAVNIEPELLHNDKKEELERYLREAINDVIKKAQRVMAQKMQGMSGFNIPGM